MKSKNNILITDYRYDGFPEILIYFSLLSVLIIILTLCVDRLAQIDNRIIEDLIRLLDPNLTKEGFIKFPNGELINFHREESLFSVFDSIMIIFVTLIFAFELLKLIKKKIIYFRFKILQGKYQVFADFGGRSLKIEVKERKDVFGSLENEEEVVYGRWFPINFDNVNEIQVLRKVVIIHHNSELRRYDGKSIQDINSSPLIFPINCDAERLIWLEIVKVV